MGEMQIGEQQLLLPGISPHFPEISAPEKRIVLHHVSGSMKDLMRIVGTVSGGVPPFLEGPFKVADDDHVIEFASLIRVTDRAVYYRETADQSNLKGKLGDFFPDAPEPTSFHPEQQ
ncbi:MAG: hypothetical protein AB7J46_06195 [Candidatus Altimarinota bacterium]